MPGPTVRARAWLLRTFRGRPRERAAWTESPALAARASFRVGELDVAAASVGLRSAGMNEPAVVYEVEVALGQGRRWTSRYGLAPDAASPEAAIEHALDELDQIWRDRERWEAELTAGMTPDEAEAMLASSMSEADLAAARWIGPELDRVRATTKGATGRWAVLPEVSPS